MKKIWNSIKVILKWAGSDGILHFVVSALLLLIFNAFLPTFIAIVLTVGIGVAKEILYDKIMDRGTAEAKDLICDIAGVIFGLLISLLYLL